MRIVHVLSLLDPQMSFGGPTRVALNQLRALQEQGHEVLLVTGVQGYDPRELTEYEGIPVKAFRAYQVPGLGFAGLIAPRMLLWLLRLSFGHAVAHVHLARDLVSTPAAWIILLRQQAYIAQTHGMIDVSTNPLAKILDVLVVRRLLRHAKTVLALTDKEREDLLEVEPRLENIRVLCNGVARAAHVAVPGEAEEVLFLARINERKRPLDFIKAAQQLAEDFPGVSFTLTGPDGGQITEVQTLLAADNAGGRIRYAGVVPPQEVRERMSTASVYVLPAINEPFAMTVLEAMSVGVPVLVRQDCGLAPLVAEAGGEVIDADDADNTELIEGIRRLLSDLERRLRFTENAPTLVDQRYGIDAVITALITIYREAAAP